MLKEILAAWDEGSLMRDAVQKLGQMMLDVEYLYNHAWETCLGQTVADEVGPEVKKHDQAVNQAERDIRKMLLEHLSLNPGKDVSGCMAVLIMAKDAERLGDHARNVFDLGVRAAGKAKEMRLFAQFDAIAPQLGAQLPRLQRGIRESDEVLAHEVIARYQAIKQELKDLTRALWETPDLTGFEGVWCAHLVRYLKRINAHQGNVASGIIFPLHNIDFVSRGLREEEKDR